MLWRVVQGTYYYINYIDPLYINYRQVKDFL